MMFFGGFTFVASKARGHPRRITRWGEPQAPGAKSEQIFHPEALALLCLHHSHTFMEMKKIPPQRKNIREDFYL